MVFLVNTFWARSNFRNRVIAKQSDTSIHLISIKGVEYLEKLTYRTGAHHPLEGLWAAIYGSHGIEYQVISLVEPANGISCPFPNLDAIPSPPLGASYLKAVKITGDDNIPAGRTTVLADLTVRVNLPHLPFQLAKGTDAYQGYLHIAQNGYQMSSFTPAIFLTNPADADSFGLYWIEVAVLTRYKRIIPRSPF